MAGQGASEKPRSTGHRHERSKDCGLSEGMVLRQVALKAGRVQPLSKPGCIHCGSPTRPGVRIPFRVGSRVGVEATDGRRHLLMHPSSSWETTLVVGDDPCRETRDPEVPYQK